MPELPTSVNLMGMDAASVKSLTPVVSQASDGPAHSPAMTQLAWEPYERARLADNSDSSDGDEV